MWLPLSDKKATWQPQTTAAFPWVTCWAMALCYLKLSPKATRKGDKTNTHHGPPAMQHTLWYRSMSYPFSPLLLSLPPSLPPSLTFPKTPQPLDTLERKLFHNIISPHQRLLSQNKAQTLPFKYLNNPQQTITHSLNGTPLFPRNVSHEVMEKGREYSENIPTY